MRHDDEAFDAFAVAAWPRLRRSALLLTGDHHLAEDLAQTALVRTYAAWHRVRRDDALAYARRIVVNANIDRLRRSRGLELVVADVPDSARRDEAEGRHEDVDLVVRLLAGLTARERRMLVLRHYFDMTEPVVAEELGVSVGTVKSTTSRALAKVRALHPGLQSTGSRHDREGM